MFTISINGESRRSREADEHWITQQVNRRRREGQPVCVRLNVESADAAMSIISCGCQGGVGGGRWDPNRKQRAVHELWVGQGLDKCDFTGGNVVAFVKQLERLL